MESIQNIKSRLGAVKNVGKITKAMEVVSATKMRKAQEIALRSRPYALRALELLRDLTEHAPVTNSLMQEREVRNTLVILVASDRGLAGSFNAQIFRVAESLLNEPHTSVIALGKKALSFAQKKNIPIIESHIGFGDFIDFSETEPVADRIIKGFREGLWNRVLTVSTHFRTTLKQETLVRQILPTDYKKIKETVDELTPEHGRFSAKKNGITNRVQSSVDYIYEPSIEVVLDELVPYLLSLQLYHVMLEANASEHSARMVAMKTASDNAEDLSRSLVLLANKARQASITKEMIEIISTQNAL
ncbi:MAG: ATP synthase F1 subunit gamma [Patescibacteria group bacterium]